MIMSKRLNTATIVGIALVALFLFCMVPIPRCSRATETEARALVLLYLNERELRGTIKDLEYSVRLIREEENFFGYEVIWPGKDLGGLVGPEIAVERSTGFVDWVSAVRIEEIEIR